MSSLCSFCKSTPSLLHSCICGQVSYCGKDCQKSDWNSHKPDCPPFITKDIPGKGRGLIATRNLSFGCNVLTERPVLVVAIREPDYDKLLSDFLSKSKETQRRILNLYDRYHHQEVNEDLSNEKDLVAKLFGIVATNGIVYEYDSDKSEEFGEEATQKVYLKASLLNHDCRPNVTWYTLPAGGTIVVNVLRPVAKGAELTVSYVGDEACSTRNQRKEKLVPFLFDCKCNICKEVLHYIP